MKSNASKLFATALAAVLLAAIPASAAARLDYSKNSVSGEYHDPPAMVGATHLDYSRNSISGEDHVVTPLPSSAIAPARGVKSGAGFSWSAAAAGAGATLVLFTLALGGTRLRRRHPAGAVRPPSPIVG